MGDISRNITHPGTWSRIKASGTYNTNTLKNREITTRVGAITPNYAELSRLGKLPMQPLSFTFIRDTGGSGAIVYTYSPPSSSSNNQTLTGDWGVNGTGVNNTKAGSDPPSQAEKDSLVAEATTRALNKIKDQKVNILQDLGESRQTVSLLKNTVQRLAYAYVAFKQGNLLRAASILGVAKPSRSFRKKYNAAKRSTSVVRREGLQGSGVFSPTNLASLWLEFRYGWMPLVYSASGAVTLYQQQLEAGKTIRIQSYASRTWEKTTNAVSHYGGVDVNHQQVCTTKGKVKYTLYYRIDRDEAVTLAQAGISNLPNLLWELTPFSFVVDWFIGIGNYLSSLDATNGLVFEKGCVTKSYRSNSIKTSTWHPTLYYLNISGSVVANHHQFTLNRDVLNDFPSPTRPVFNRRGLGLQQYLSAAALLVTVFYGKGSVPYHMR
jgi:hypothetical protein